jgi:hypothetical protein
MFSLTEKSTAAVEGSSSLLFPGQLGVIYLVIQLVRSLAVFSESSVSRRLRMSHLASTTILAPGLIEVRDKSVALDGGD